MRGERHEENMRDYEGRRLEETGGRWRAFAWILTALGFLGIAVLSYKSARAGYYGYDAFSLSQFFWTFLVDGLILLAVVWPLFLIAQLLRGLAAALRGRAADWLHPRPETWRFAAWGLTVLGALGAASAAYSISVGGRSAGLWEGSGTPFLVAFLALLLVWMLEVWPLFILWRALDAVAVLTGQAPGMAPPDAAPARAEPPAAGDAAPGARTPAVFAPCPACGRPINRDLQACPYCRADSRREAPPAEPPGAPPEALD
jgi:hypothetical protein